MNPLLNFLGQFARPHGYHQNRAPLAGGPGHKAGRAGQQKKQIEQRRRQKKATKKTHRMQRRQAR